MSLGDYIKDELPKWPKFITVPLLLLNCFRSIVYGRAYWETKRHLNDANPEELLLEMVNYAIKNVPYYRKLYGDIIIHSKEEFQEKIGFIDKDEVMAHWEEFLVDGIDWSKVKTGTTGGTSGKPLKLVTSINRYAWELAYMHSMWEKVGWHYHTRGVLRNHDLHGQDYAVNPVTKEILFDPQRMSEDYVKMMCRVMKRFRVKYMQAYPSNAYQFCILCERAGIDIGFISAFLCGSEGITALQKECFIRHGIRFLTWYGHSEKLILGSNDGENMVMKIEPTYGMCELISEDGKVVSDIGQSGEMTGTSYHNRCFPLIRYKTGDFATLHKSGSSMELVNIVGRWNNSLIYRKDGTATSATALNLHGSFYEHINGLQYVQERKGYVKVLIIKNNLFTQQDENFFVDFMANAMGGREYVEIEYVDKLIIQPNGKFLPLISKLNITGNIDKIGDKILPLGGGKLFRVSFYERGRAAA